MKKIILIFLSFIAVACNQTNQKQQETTMSNLPEIPREKQITYGIEITMFHPYELYINDIKADYSPNGGNTAVKINPYVLKNGKLEGGVPIDFLSKTEQKRLYLENGELNYNLYKVLLFKKVANHIKAGSLNLLFSERYKSIDEYLINWERWENNKEELLSRVGLDKLKNPHDSLFYFKDYLHKQYEITNENSKDNQYLKFSSKGIAKVSTPKASEEISEKDIILKFVNRDRFCYFCTVTPNSCLSLNITNAF